MPTATLSAAAAAAAAAAELVRVASAAATQVLELASRTAAIQSESSRVDLAHIKDDLAEIKARLDSKFVSIDTFEPIRRVVYGLVTLILVGVVGALIAMVVKR